MSGMNWLMLSPVKPELFLVGVGLLLLMVGALRGKSSVGFILAAVLASFAVGGAFLCLSDAGMPLDTLGGMVAADGFSVWMRLLILSGLFVSTLLLVGWLKENQVFKFEIPLLYLLSGVGMLFMVSATNLLSLYVSLELSSLCLYVLAAINRDNLKSTESGLKYFILGALSSGLLLFGISLVYGFTATLSYAEIGAILSQMTLPAGAMVGMVFILAGLVFKISAVPFHMWTPDVYEGAPTPVTALFAIVPKVAAFGLIIRLLTGPFASLHEQASQIIVFVALASSILGAFAGLAQNNFKRLIAYSSIANMGYALLGLLSGTPEGVASVVLYLTIYMVITAGVFAVLMGLKREGHSVETISDFAGLVKKCPVKAYCMTGLLFSMSGLPPLAGFFAKLFVFQAAVAGGYFVVAVIGVLASVVASYYYLRVIKVMLFDTPQGEFDTDCCLSRKAVMIGAVAFILIFTLVPNYLLDQAQVAAGTLFP